MAYTSRPCGKDAWFTRCRPFAEGMSDANDPTLADGPKARSILGGCRLAQDLVIELSRKAEHCAYAFRLEPDEEDRLAGAQLIVLGDDVELVGVERRQSLQISGAILEVLEIAAVKIVVLGVHLLDSGEDGALWLADHRGRNHAIIAVISGAMLLHQRAEFFRGALQSGQTNQRDGKGGAGGDLEPNGHDITSSRLGSRT